MAAELTPCFQKEAFLGEEGGEAFKIAARPVVFRRDVLHADDGGCRKVLVMRPQFAQPDLDLLAYAEMQGLMRLPPR